MCNAYRIEPKRAAVAALEIDVSERAGRLPSPLVRRGGRGLAVALGIEGPEAVEMRWGYHRSFSDAINNARSDKLGSLMWAESLRERRCLIPVSAFYEWGEGSGGRKQAYEFRGQDDWMWMAGLFENSEEHGPCYTMITTDASERVAPIHDRMPAILKWNEALAFLKDGLDGLPPYEGALRIAACESPLRKHDPASGEQQGMLF